MSFLLREMSPDDLGQLYNLARQFVLINLPADKNVLTKKIEVSMASFSGSLSREESEYLFAIEDKESGQLVGSSQVIAKHGTPEVPHLSFKVITRDHTSEDLGIGFKHKVLQFQEEVDGPTEIGGLLVDQSYRRRPEKVGRQVSLIRFLYMAMNPDRFSDRVHCELAPPLTEEGRSEFWEALGRRFTGLPYQEADQLSHVNKEFIRKLFPDQDIYMTLLDSKARLVLGRVSEATQPAKYLLEKIGFRYLNEVDPFDGGPHYGATTRDITIVRNSRTGTIKEDDKNSFSQFGLVGTLEGGRFRAIQTAFEVSGDSVFLPQNSRELLDLGSGAQICFSPYAVKK